MNPPIANHDTATVRTFPACVSTSRVVMGFLCGISNYDSENI
jgi:hypothetical protein